MTTSLPSLTLTFVYREIFALQERGYQIETVSMNRPAADEVSEEARHLLSSTAFLDGISWPRQILSLVQTMLFSPRAIIALLRVYFFARPMSGSRDYLRLAYHLIEACDLYQRYKHTTIDHIHCHFISGPTSIGLFLATLMGVEFSFTMHASLIWKDPIALVNKLDLCRFCVSISEYNKTFVLQTYGEHYREKIHIVHCGTATARNTSRVDRLDSQKKTSASLRLLGIGQLTERKGFLTLIEACYYLNCEGVDFHCHIVGEGAQRQQLEQRIDEFNLQARVTLVGALAQEAIPPYLHSADLFVLPCVIAADGLRDGIPVALMEAMQYQLPVISTDILGLAELIDHGVNGLLVEPRAPRALADAIARLAADPCTRAHYGAAAAEKVAMHFNTAKSAEQLDRLFS